jgi:hypothetical protein
MLIATKNPPLCMGFIARVRAYPPPRRTSTFAKRMRGCNCLNNVTIRSMDVLVWSSIEKLLEPEKLKAA